MIISAHAFLRWLERIEGEDVEALRARLRPATLDRRAALSDSALVALFEKSEPKRHARIVALLTEICAPAARCRASSLQSEGLIYRFRGETLMTVMCVGGMKRRRRARLRAHDERMIAGVEQKALGL